MGKIEIGAGFAVTALAGFGLLQDPIANTILLLLGIVLIPHGVYEIFFKPRMYLRQRITRWLLARNWKVRIEDKAGFYFIMWAEDESHRELAITRDKKDAGILAFTARVPLDKDWSDKLDKLNNTQRNSLVEEIKVFFASKDMGFAEAKWPLHKISAQHALSLTTELSEHTIDLKAKEAINAVIGVRSLIRKSLTLLESDKEGSQT